MSNQPEIIIGLHDHQPPRGSYHIRLRHIKPDPQKIDWTEIITTQSYKPHVKLGILKQVTYDYSGTLDHDLERIDPEVRDAMRTHLGNNGVADTYIHALLPNQSPEDKFILIKAGIDRYVRITGKRPRFMWCPETAIDTATLEVMAECGIEGFFCSPDQVELNDGNDANNIPTRIRPPSGRAILALPYDRELSHKLAFDDPNHPLRDDAYKFRDVVIRPALNRLRNGFPLMSYNDGETFGHHMQWGGDFIDTLVNRALPEAGIELVSINEDDFNKVTIAEGRIKERSAWSCGHGNLARWHGGCNCNGEADVSWKRPLAHAFHELNRGITRLIKAELGPDYIEKVVSHFEEGYKNPGGTSTNLELSLESSKISVLKVETSCATFFKDPGVSGGGIIVCAREVIEHLKDAGLHKEAARAWTNFLNNMKAVRHPLNNMDGVEMVKNLLGADLAMENYLPVVV